MDKFEKLKAKCRELVGLWEQEMENEDADEETKEVFDHCRCQLIEAIDSCDE